MNGKISISAPSSSTKGQCVSIRIEDENSALRIIEVEMTFEDYGKLIAGLSYVPCQYNITKQHENLGKYRETAIIKSFSDLLRSLPQFEIDRITSEGWIISQSHLENSNNFKVAKEGSSYKYDVNVYVHRFVEKENNL